MTGEQAAGFLFSALVGGLAASLWLPTAIRAAPASLVRVNVRGREVPAVLGLPLVMGGALGLGFAYALDRGTHYVITTHRIALAMVLVLLVSAAAGWADDRRGDEHARGFGGHLKAAARGRITGGLVKIAGVGLAGLGAGLLLGSGWYVVEVTMLVALSANLVNLFDRAPGRAGKVAVLGAFLLIGLGSGAWAGVAGGMVGALLVCLGPDLRERAMLGDAGANPLGAILGLGLAVSLDRTGRLVAIGLLVAVNLASERWSFSRGIERVALLRSFDRLGRL